LPGLVWSQGVGVAHGAIRNIEHDQGA
jgi:hypothetical protein